MAGSDMKASRSGKKTARRGSKRVHKVERIPPNLPAARDEGPRLLPLDGLKEPSRLEHLLDLADAALQLKPQSQGHSSTSKNDNEE
jgi:hypothetical protein